MLRRINQSMRVAAFFGAVAMAFGAYSESITYSKSFAYAKTNWTDVFSVNQFNPNLGVLDTISIAFSGSIKSRVRVENLEDHAMDLFVATVGKIVLLKPDYSAYAQLLPQFTNPCHFAAFDGTLDFAGASGCDVWKANTVSTTLAPSGMSDMNPFIGNSTVDLGLSAKGSTLVSAIGNYKDSYETYASADVSVTYFYHMVPEPAGLLLGLAALLLARRRK